MTLIKMNTDPVLLVIIITGKTALFEPWPSLKDSARFVIWF
jgi:hypothetical protein